MDIKPLKQCDILIVGLGMIGGSIARGLKLANPGQHIAAIDLDRDALGQALAQGVIDQAPDLGQDHAQADLVILALPPVASARILSQLAPHLAQHTIVTDVASVKSHIIEAAESLGSEFAGRFVPGHPIAGSERSGYAASNAELFQDRKVILTPLATNSPDAVALVHSLWHELGATVLGMSVQRHDEVLAATSHLPHLLAYAIVDVLAKQARSEDIFRYAAGGFADFSRLASSDARMWADIFQTNAASVTAVLDAYIDELADLRSLIEQRDDGRLMTIFTQAKSTREQFLQKHFGSGHGRESMDREIDFRLDPGGTVSGELRVPGDKSISHRSIICGAIAEGITRITGFLEGEDALNTVAAFREMGVTIVGPDNGQVTIYGVGKHGLKAPRKPLYMGNSGTAMRLLAGLLAAQAFSSELTGDDSLNRRPMNRVAEPLREMGAQLQTAAGGRPPLRIDGSRLHGIDYRMKIASAQVKSCLLLAGLYAEGETTVTEPVPCRDHTERMLAGFGYPLRRDSASRRVSIQSDGSLQGTEIDVPSDISSAAFFLVAAAISPGASLTLRHVGVNPTRTGIIHLLRQMGADLTLSNEREAGGEPVADITVRHSPLEGIVVPREQIPLAIDEFPVLFIAAACAGGETLLRGAEELRVKESDRIAAMAAGLTVLGIESECFDDGIRIVGGQLGGGEIDSQGDHRIAMAFAVAALRADAPILIRNCANVATSFPGFVDLARQAGIRIEEQAALDHG